MKRKSKFLIKIAILLAAGLGMLVSANAHEIPADVRLHVFFKPAGSKLEILVRAPMSALREVDFPKRGPGYLVISKADEALRNAAKLWLIDSLDIYENDARLPAPRIVHVRVSLPSDTSFTSYASALANLKSEPLADTLDLGCRNSASFKPCWIPGFWYLVG